VGFWHEHTRPDRDEHVVIIRENIMTGQEYNFNKLTPDEVNSLQESYDFDSIMHYARNTFSRSTFLDTILPKEDPNSRHRPEIGQRIRLSSGDIAQANRLYKCPSCGRTLQDPQGALTSPYHPNLNQSSGVNSSSGENAVTSGAGEKCEWRIVATHGETIILNITDFDLPYSDGCKYDYLEIRDGYWHKSPLLGRFCGSNLKFESAILSTGARMLLTYVTTKPVATYRGFTASYEAVCGGDLVDESGHLESPNFPDEYLPSKECIWKITVPVGYQVALTFHSFEIENHENCVYDFLEIRDGITPNSTLIGTYCGYYPPSPLTSSSNTLWVRFVSDGSVQKAGFSASYLKELDECARGLDDCEHMCKNTIGSYTCGCKFGFELHSNGKECEDACGGVLEETNGTLTSPSFPNLYPSNKHCAWEIVAPPQTRITINFTHFDLEGNNQECDYDSVEVYSKLAHDELKRHGTFCGSKPPTMISSEGNSIRIVFTSDNSVQKTGFALVFFTDQDECATENGGCAHICRNTVGSYVCLCHNGFTLHENGHDCKEGGCKFELSTPSGTNELESPNYPEPYPGKKECIWIISTVQGHRVKLVFDEFEVEPQQDCSYDAVFIYDGGNSDSPLLGKFCGSKTPHPLISSGNAMMVLFKSDGSVHRRGFHGRHFSVCGGLLLATGDDDFIYSHASYGDSTYGDSEDCEWIIELDNNYEDIEDLEGTGQSLAGVPGGGAGNGRNFYIELTFLTFEIEDEVDCAFDYVEIYDGEDPGGPSTKSLGRFCGNRLPPPIKSEENGNLLIRFKSDDTVNGKGFSAIYKAVESTVIKPVNNYTKSIVV
jgi:tolkin protein